MEKRAVQMNDPALSKVSKDYASMVDIAQCVWKKPDSCRWLNQYGFFRFSYEEFTGVQTIFATPDKCHEIAFLNQDGERVRRQSSVVQ